MRALCSIKWAAIAAAAFAIAGCGPKEETTAAKAKLNPDAKLEGNVEVMAFKGGYGTDFYEQAAKEFEAKHAGLKISVSGNPRVWEQIRPRMVSGDPPDLMFPGWDYDHWAAIEEGAIMPLDDALDAPAEGGTGKWRDTFDPNVLRLCQKDGKTYMLPLYVMIYGWWYDPGLFAKNGWTPPTTWDELLTLCEKIKAAGIAPITYQGQYPYYMLEGMLIPWTYAHGGMEALDAMQNLEPGAWKSASILDAARRIDELNKKGYFQKGATGMSHTESQTQFLNGKAAMIPCGSWLYSEMKAVMPKGSAMEYFRPPLPDGGKGDPTMTIIGFEPWMIPTQAKNPNAAAALFRYMTSLEKAKQFVTEKGTPMAILGSDAAEMPAVMRKPAEALKSAKQIWSNQYRNWYKAFQKEVEDALTLMLNGELTPEQFVDKCEAAAEKTRSDSSIPKYRVQ